MHMIYIGTEDPLQWCFCERTVSSWRKAGEKTAASLGWADGIPSILFMEELLHYLKSPQS